MFKDFDICQYLSELAIKSMLYEVSATPKPGLVDRNNAGAHKDMDFFTFMASSAALSDTFYQCAKAGAGFEGKALTELMNSIRPIGIQGEKRMFQATQGINTHKGLIFSLGIIVAVAAVQYGETQSLKMNVEKICDKVKEMTKGISDRELGNVSKASPSTYGEKLFQKYGVKGIRGEVESGFHTVRTHSLPILQELIKSGKSMNDTLVQVLLHLMTVTEDSNVLGRHDWEALEYVKASAKELLNMGGMFTEEGRQRLVETDREFIRKNISPGGSADLLAVTMMLYSLKKCLIPWSVCNL
ncbi:triphosphoribosyl-dephospho-CoA synthase CitG [Clostridium formicaceticum]|uniref:Probable 2-(5''-triphosphoribosyl)-3'-dephosphocoenzyme-A synthase n=1 Tax=Clostridium formicaceticum TaxID=1497 RepID=A0AAC9WHU6_9CLOT|nr:triphosphoribosyl-dephospho-CoA synthase CitG [Clostridium formicaceticum]ARE89341.1 2-(5''-triphosphoribosyl)-3'-dephosphocoenzyme-A synthase [Clostridium formicaceticum]